MVKKQWMGEGGGGGGEKEGGGGRGVLIGRGSIGKDRWEVKSPRRWQLLRKGWGILEYKGWEVGSSFPHCSPPASPPYLKKNQIRKCVTKSPVNKSHD